MPGDNINDIISLELLQRFETLKGDLVASKELLDAINSIGKQVEATFSTIGGTSNLSKLNATVKESKININEQEEAVRKMIEADKAYAQFEAEVAKKMALTTAEAKKQLEAHLLLEKQVDKTWQTLLKEKETLDMLLKSKEQDIIFTNEQEISTEAFNEAQERLAASFGPLNAAENQSTAAKKENIVTTEAQLTQAQQVAKTLFILKEELVNTNLAMKENVKAVKAGTLSEEEYTAAQTILTEKQILLKEGIKSTTLALKESEGITKDSTAILDKFTNMVQRMGLRMLANLIIFQAAIEAFTILSKRMQDTSDRENAVYNAGIKIHQDAGAAYAKEAAEFEGLIARFKSGASTMEEKQQVVKDLNDKYGDQIGKLKGIADAEKFIEDKSQDFLNALYLRAQGEAALGVISEATAKNIKNAANGGADLLDTFDQIGAGITGAFSTAAGATQLYSTAQKKLKEDTDANNAAIKSAKDQYVAFMQQADAIAQKNGFDFNNGAPNAAKLHDFTMARVKNEQELTKLLGEEEAKRLQAEMQGLRIAYEDESNSLEDRLTAFRNYQNLKLAAQQAGTDAQADEARVALKKIKQIEDAAAAGGTIQPQEQALLDRKKVYLEQIKLATADEQLAEATNARETQDGIDKIYKQSAQLRIQQLQYITENVIAQEAEAQQGLRAKYNDGLITWEEYLKDKKALTDQYAAQAVREQALYLQNEINFSNLSDDAIVELKRKLTEKLKELYGLDFKNWEDNESKKVAAKKQAEQEIQHLVMQGIQLAQAAENQHFQSQIDHQERLMSKLEDENSLRVALINAQYTNETERNNALARNELQYSIQKKQIQSEEISIKRKQAVANKEAAIAEAIEGGAVAVVNALKIPIYGEALAIAIAAITAGQIAVIASAPLPQYATGTKSKPTDGFAIVGEKGMELVTEPSGKQYLTPDTASVMSIPKASSILTHEETMKAIQNRTLAGLANIGAPIDEWAYAHAMMQAGDNNTNKLVKAINNNKGQPIYIPVPDYKWNTYVKNKIN